MAWLVLALDLLIVLRQRSAYRARQRPGDDAEVRAAADEAGVIPVVLVIAPVPLAHSEPTEKERTPNARAPSGAGSSSKLLGKGCGQVGGGLCFLQQGEEDREDRA